MDEELNFRMLGVSTSTRACGISQGFFLFFFYIYCLFDQVSDVRSHFLTVSGRLSGAAPLVSNFYMFFFSSLLFLTMYCTLVLYISMAGLADRGSATLGRPHGLGAAGVECDLWLGSWLMPWRHS